MNIEEILEKKNKEQKEGVKTKIILNFMRNTEKEEIGGNGMDYEEGGIFKKEKEPVAKKSSEIREGLQYRAFVGNIIKRTQETGAFVMFKNIDLDMVSKTLGNDLRSYKKKRI